MDPFWTCPNVGFGYIIKYVTHEQIENVGSVEGSPLACHCAGRGAPRARPRSGGSVRAQLLSAACPARRHLRLEGLRTLVGDMLLQPSDPGPWALGRRNENFWKLLIE